MRHNHKNHIGSPCRFVDVFDVLPNWKNRNPHRSPKSEKPRCFCQKTENQMLKKGKTGNHNGQQNRKTDVFHCKNRKTDLENAQNRKTENPNAPLLKYLRQKLSIPTENGVVVARWSLSIHSRNMAKSATTSRN